MIEVAKEHAVDLIVHGHHQTAVSNFIYNKSFESTDVLLRSKLLKTKILPNMKMRHQPHLLMETQELCLLFQARNWCRCGVSLVNPYLF